MDSESTHYDSYEQWALDHGYDPDSIAGQQVYPGCRVIAANLLRVLGQDAVDQLIEAINA